MDGQQSPGAPESGGDADSPRDRHRNNTPELPPGAIPISNATLDAIKVLENFECPEEEGEPWKYAKLFWMGNRWTREQFDEAEKEVKRMEEEMAEMDARSERKIKAMEEKFRLEAEAREAQWKQDYRDRQAQLLELSDTSTVDFGNDTELRRLLTEYLEQPVVNTYEMLGERAAPVRESLVKRDAPICELASVVAMYGVYLELTREDGGYLGFEAFRRMFEIRWY